MGVGDAQARGHTGEAGRRHERQPARQRLVHGRAEEPASQHVIGTLALQCVDQTGDLGGAVLAVAVEGHDHVGALEQRKLDPGLQAGALPQIDRMLHHHRPGLGGGAAGGVGRAVVDDDHSIGEALELGDDARDHRRLVIGGDDDPDALRVRPSGCMVHPATKRRPHKISTMPITRRSEIGSAKKRPPSAGVSAKASATNG